MKKLEVSHTTAGNEIRRRAPWMLLALVAGIVMVLVGQNFEAAFSRNIELAFFVPVIVSKLGISLSCAADYPSASVAPLLSCRAVLWTVSQEGAAMAKLRESRVMSRAMTRARQYVCGLHGHDALLHFEPHRVSLQCTSCGYETPGWDLKPVIACEDADVIVRQARRVRPRLANEQRA